MTLRSFDTGLGLLLHHAFAPKPPAERSFWHNGWVRFMAAALATFGVMLLVVAVSRRDVMYDTAIRKLPFAYDWNTMWQFLLTFPLLFTFLLSERTLIPDCLTALLENKILSFNTDEKEFVDWWQKCYCVVNVGTQLIGVFVGWAVAYFNYIVTKPADWGAWQAVGGSFHLAGWIWLICLAVFYFVVSIWVGRAVTTAVFLAAVVRNATVRLVAFHPDNCGGLKPIGVLGLRNQYVLAIGGVNVLLLILVTRVLDPSPILFGLIVAACILYVVAGPMSFLGPLLPFRSAMKQEKQKIVNRIGMALQRQYESCLQSLDKGPSDSDQREEVEQLQRFLATARKIPVWPFDTVTLRKFLAAYVVPLASLIASPAISSLVGQVVTRAGG